MGNAIARQTNNSCLASDERQIKFVSEKELNEEWRCLVLPFAKPQLSEMSGCGPEGVRLWLKGLRGPNTASVFNLAQHLPTVQDWVAMRCGIERAVQARSYDIWLQGLYAIAAGNGPDAMKARWAIGRLHHSEESPAIPERDTRTIDLFTRRRA